MGEGGGRGEGTKLKKALKMTSQVVIFRAGHFQSFFFFFFFFFFLISPEQTVKLVK